MKNWKKQPYPADKAAFPLLFLPLKGNNDAAVGVNTGRVGGDAGNLLQRGVNHMAFIGVHRLQRDAAAVLDYLSSHLVCKALQALLPLGTVIFRIQLDTDPAAGTVDGITGELLDGIQRLTPAADDGTEALPLPKRPYNGPFREGIP